MQISQVGVWPRKFLPRNFKLITDTIHGWKLNHENFICENLFLRRIWQNREIFNLENFRLYGMLTAAIIAHNNNNNNNNYVTCSGKGTVGNFSSFSMDR